MTDAATIDWLTFEQLTDSLDKNPKMVMINFHTDWCTYCRKMHREVFTNPEVIQTINESYYAVSFDAETRDSVYFDGQWFINKEATNRRRGFHELAQLLGNRNGRITVPTTLFLNPDFTIRHRSFEYLSSRKLLDLLNP
ncbi:MAG TPA: thioredoxin family protein [Sphingobacteriaceae bacterium]|nr:thioredoxin family protein [Sphingobacteriaceae bacterium]